MDRWNRTTVEVVDPPMETPRSLGSVRKLGPLAMLLAVVITLTQWGALAGNEAWIVFLFLGIPAFTSVAIAFNVARRDRGNAWTSASIGFVLHFFVVLVAAAYETAGSVEAGTFVVALIVTAVSMGVWLVVSAPLLVAMGHFAKRTDLAAGDELLAFSGAWFLVLQAIELALEHSWLAPWVPVMALTVVPIAIATSRGARRRAWCRRVERGEIPGLRFRAWGRSDIELDLPAIDDAPDGDVGVVEQVVVGSVPYRSGIVGVPIALMRSHLAPEVTP